MRKFLTTTASVTFFDESKYTARFKKDHLEYIVRNLPGMCWALTAGPSSPGPAPDLAAGTGGGE